MFSSRARHMSMTQVAVRAIECHSNPVLLRVGIHLGTRLSLWVGMPYSVQAAAAALPDEQLRAAASVCCGFRSAPPIC